MLLLVAAAVAVATWLTELNSILSETRFQSTWRAVDAIDAATADIIYGHFSQRFSISIFAHLMFLLSLALARTCFDVRVPDEMGNGPSVDEQTKQHSAFRPLQIDGPS